MEVKMVIDQYKSILISKNKQGEISLYPKSNADIINQIIPDALEYVKNHNFKFRDGVYLCRLNGVDIEIFPNSNLKNLIFDWKENYFSESGICVEV